MATTLTKTTQEFMTAFNSHDLEKLLSLYTNDAAYEDVGLGVVYHGLQEIRKNLNDFFKSFPDVKMEFTSDFRSGDWGASEWVMTGTNKGNMPAIGGMPEIPATNKKISLKGATILQFRNNKVSREADYWDMATFARQLGLMPAQPGK